MKHMLFALFSFVWVCCLPVNTAAADSEQAYIIDIDGIISPATADYFTRSLEKAIDANAALFLVRLDTPGGLDLSMRGMIKQIIASPVPIVMYVTPGGARAASAGTYLLYSSHIAAMTPATNLGAATPVQLKPSFISDEDKSPQEKTNKETEPNTTRSDDAMTRKVVNDAVAYIKGLADLHNRNKDWAEKAVRDAASLTAEAALELKVIDIVANNQRDLLEQLDGRTVSVLGTDRVLNTQSLTLIEVLPDWRNKVLAVITNPNIAYILMMIGIYGLIFEFANPGSIVPGTVGSICLLLALFSLQILPINYAGLALILLGIALMVAEAFQPSFGVLGLGGVAAFAVGSVMLIDVELPGYGINLGVIAGFTVSTVAFFLMALGMVLRNRKQQVTTGQEQMIGATCVAVDDIIGQGRVWVHGEQWTARSKQHLKKGDRAEVLNMHGLILEVKPISTQEHKS
ncbi:NfeD family protein [Methylophaga thiooxydans]|uniref:NfeD family protein n=1 Tax=Methylophaga thiooxydans TaxID=392484 RepID=UPI0023577F2A|nr:nodulation protein NfeD [Methylophaga thiooxydans]